MSPLRCPSCQSLDLTLEGAEARCNNCGRPSALVDGRLTPRQAPSRTPVYAGLVAAAVACGAGLWWWQQGDAAVTPAPTDTPAPTPAEATPPAAPRPTGPARAELRHAVDRPAGDGRFWIATYVNAGGEPIRDPALVVRLLDDMGAVVQEIEGDVVRSQLEPGESAPGFVVATELPKHARAELVAAPLAKAEGAPWKVPLEVAGLVDKPMALGATVVAGQLRNPHPAPARFIDVSVVGMSEDGRPVAWATGLSPIPDLAPGATVGFQVRFSAFVAEPPHHYEAWAQANLKGRQ